MSFTSASARVLVLALALGGCSESRYSVSLAPDTALEGAAGFDLVLLWPSCQQIFEQGGIVDRGWIVARSQWQAGQTPPDIGEVEPGGYALIGLVRAADCTAAWAGCEDVVLERGGDGVLEVTLQSIGVVGCLPQEVCNGAGYCVPAPQCDNVTIGCDDDGDGWRRCLEGQNPAECDCWDESGDVHPGEAEYCDGLDNDCNGVEDDNPECVACLDQCPDFNEDNCERPDCSTGECQILPRRDGASCNGGTAFCCGGVCEGACDPNAPPEQRDCGVGGSQTRTCQEDCSWSDWSVCDEGPECGEGDTREDQPCGNCMTGRRDDTCSPEGTWVLGNCVGAGICAPNATREVVCNACGTLTETCQDDCTWGDPGDCALDPDAPADACELPAVCCPDGSCGDATDECCGTDTSTCGAEPGLCQDWTCVGGVCTAVDTADNTDPEDECAANCCDGAGACAPCA